MTAAIAAPAADRILVRHSRHRDHRARRDFRGGRGGVGGNSEAKMISREKFEKRNTTSQSQKMYQRLTGYMFRITLY